MTTRRAKRTDAFTLVEMLVVIAIIALLVGLTIPIVGRALESGRVVACGANLKKIGQALFMYTMDNDNVLPRYHDGSDSWDGQILPYAGDDATSFRCPSDPYIDETILQNEPRSYSANGGIKALSFDFPFGADDGQEPYAMDKVKSRSGPVILVGERPGDSMGARGYVGEFPYCTLDGGPSSVHRGGKGANYLFSDMAVMYLTVEEATINADTDYWYIQ